MLISEFRKIDDVLVGQKIQVGGFVNVVRDHGGLIFIDLRSGKELLQCVINPEKNPEGFKKVEHVKNESVVKVVGTLLKRDEGLVNPNILTGKWELEIEDLEVVSKAKMLPFDIHADEKNMANEELRLKYRYLDLRREKLKELLKRKHKLFLDVRRYFDENDFIEVTTPILANSSPEGARDFLVPARLQPGSFYALPQAPQQFKQLLMVGGFTKYFQIAPCFRDEDPRADRAYGEFYQIDAEMAWFEPEDVKKLCEDLVKNVFMKHTTKKLGSEEFVRVEYQDAMERYGSDKPDLRYDLAWQDVKPVFKNSGFKVFADLCEDKNARVQALKVPGAVNNFSRSDLDKIQAIGREFGLPGIAYIQYFEDGAKSPIFKFFGETEEQINAKREELDKYLDAKIGDLVLFIANKDKNIVFKAQNAMRKHIAQKLDLIDENVMQFVWIDNMPFFEQDEKSGKIEFGHNPFSVWPGGLKTLLEAKSQGVDALLNLKAMQYDIAVNGYEVLSGGVRNQDPESLKEAFRICGYTDEEVNEKFGHMVEAYEFGAPTHAGFAWGIDRLFMVMNDEENIREVIAFPKNGSGMDVMLNTPSTVRPSQLKELGIKFEE